ncbi:mersacidin/lichenicidin family type 2 lantibiotic [Micromonospora vulcania]|uniref:Mersacidin/lichenicidin family type 2 lantibiotic n=1 Tax=Micromonospora vulcania TaxID=1441873 RepID=A0ABW1H597_9ACTN
MNTIIRAWKDPAFRVTLDDTGPALMEDSPVGAVGGIDDEFTEVVGADRAFTFYTCFTCQWGSLGCGTSGCTWCGAPHGGC